ncbi:MAG: hypothetical protein LLF94_05075 [Chlamydiales bacterium]|nr:hypothetical protein [Chlamydiales bacterium]
MKIKNVSIAVLLFLITSASFVYSQHYDTHPFVAAQKDLKEHLEHVQKQVEARWKIFSANKTFTYFETAKTDLELTNEFIAILDTRKEVWTATEYARAHHLVDKKQIRHPHCIAFAYNHTVKNYNASTVFINDRPYIACEGPKRKSVPAFFNLLSTLEVTHLVRLTDAKEGKKRKCHPYWIISSGQTPDKKTYLVVPKDKGIHPIRTFDVPEWQDNQGFDPVKLCKLASKVRKEIQANSTLLAVHCSAGVGRTGTFLAALAILDAIDTGKSFSIQEIVYRLSLQRIYAVSTPGQYITLHRMAEHYLNKTVKK